MRTPQSHVLRSAVSGLALAALLAGCGPALGGGKKKKDAEDSDARTFQPGSDAAQPEGGDGFQVGADADPIYLDDLPEAPDGTLVGSECDPGRVECNGTSVMACAADGAGWFVVETCTGSSMCDDGTGTCVCVANCANKDCGDDGCGGSCGTCPGGASCNLGSCDCTASCAGKQCGDDGCGGSCGTCPGGQSCSFGTCACNPQCGGKQCGSDGCGGSCGTCLPGWSCSAAGQCETVTASCNPSGTGTQVGQQVKNLTWQSSTGTQVQLHSYCKAEGAVVAVEVAGW